MRNITIHSRPGEIEGVTDGVVAAFDFFHSEAGEEVRHYVLLKESVKLMFEPWKLKGSGWRDHWYIDLVKINPLSDSAIDFRSNPCWGSDRAVALSSEISWQSFELWVCDEGFPTFMHSPLYARESDMIHCFLVCPQFRNTSTLSGSYLQSPSNDTWDV